MQAIVVNTAFSRRRQSILHQDEKHVEKLYDKDAITEINWNLLYLSSISLQDALVELLWFHRINYEAMDRIYTKLVRSGQAYSQELEECRRGIRTHIAEHRKAYKSCVEQLDRVQARAATSQRFGSGCRIDPLSLDRNHQAVAAMFPNEGFLTQEGSSQNPLHIAAMYGMVNLCMHLLSTVSQIERYIVLQDEAGISPLQTSVARGHVEVAKLLFSATDVPSTMIPGDLLHIALRREDDAMVKILLSKKVGFDYRSSSGENCLHVAAKLGREDYLRLLLPMLEPDSVDATEYLCLWTPLFVGCVEGHFSTVKLLLDAGADSTRLDYLGWTAQENAAFRGHLPVAELFPATNAISKLIYALPSSIPQRKKASLVDASPGLSHVVLNLGGLQEREMSKSLALNLPDTPGHGLLLSISTSESTTSVERMIPPFDDLVDDTLVFAFRNLSKAAIVFSIRKSDAEQEDRGTLVGTGIALLYTQSMCLDRRHGTLVREQSVPILSRDTMRLLGTIDFSYLIIGPYSKLGHSTPSFACLEDAGPTQLVGHRGIPCA
jgi:glycerophosphodiester phosphodiesterase